VHGGWLWHQVLEWTTSSFLALTSILEACELGDLTGIATLVEKAGPDRILLSFG
jgi:hypothetical protein